MRKQLLYCILAGMSLCHTEAYALDVPKTYVPKNKGMYHKEWVDFNKNGKKDVYEEAGKMGNGHFIV